jgi:integrase
MADWARVIGEEVPPQVQDKAVEPRRWLVVEYSLTRPELLLAHVHPHMQINRSRCYVQRGQLRKVFRELEQYGDVATSIPEEIDAILPPRLVHGDGSWAPKFPPNLLELALLRSVKRPNTIKSYLNAAHNFCKFAGRDPERWTGYKVVEWREALKTMPTERASGDRRPMTIRSINAKLAALRFACKRAIALGLIKDDFARAAELLPFLLEKKRYAYPVQVAGQILGACSGGDDRSVRDRAIVTLGFYHGLRRESLASMKVEDIERGSVAVTVVIKGGRMHRVSLDPRSRGALNDWASVLHKKFKVSSGAVFRRVQQTIRGPVVGERQLSGNSIYNIVRARAKEAGVDGFYPHLMRHCFISWFLANGGTIEEAMLITGHRNPRSLFEYLSEVPGLSDKIHMRLPNLEGPV